MSVMQSGTQMVKLKAGSKGLVRLFYLDEHRSCIRWKPSRKSEKAKITIDSLYKVTEGGQSDIFHRHADGSFDPACCFTVYHGNHMESLDLVTSNAEEARTWITGLRYLMAGISDEDSLAKRQRTHDQYPLQKEQHLTPDKNGDGLLNIEEIYQLLHKLNVNLPRRKVKQMFQEADTDDQQGTLTYEEFSVFYKMMSLRRDLFLLMMAYSDRKDHLTVEELANFLHNEQKIANVTPEYVTEIIDKFEVCDENKQGGVMGIEGFTNFMRSPACDIFNPLHHEINQDMDQPLCNYFIASSHNTYLTGDQLLSHSKTDMYAWVLQSGCRCVEVDCWDGPDGEPMVQHGYTLTSKIPFKSVIETINKYAFVNNQYPVILSIENHCSIQQQKKIAEYLREIFGDKLDVRDVLSKDHKTLPSPHSLQGKILIKGKRLPAYLSADAEEGEVSDDDSADEIEDDFKLKSSNGNGHHQVESHIRKKLDSLLKESRIGDKEDTDSFSIRALLRATHQGLQNNLRQVQHQRHCIRSRRHSKSRLSCQNTDKEDDGQERSGREAGGQFNRGGRKRKTMKLSRDLSNLVVFTNSVASQECLNEGTPGDVLSFSETRAQSLVNHKAEQFLGFNQRQLSRIYPSAYRIDSSNFNPQFYWNVGCQLVALNYQTEGRMMQLNRAKFMVNGGIGYVLKPPPMCKGSFNPFSDDPLPAYPKKQLVLKIISGQQLPKPPDSMLGDRGEIIDPFVEVEIIGLPVDCCKEQTRVVDDNGFNPVWEESLSFTLHMAEMALVRFLVWDHDPIGRDFIGQRTVAFSSLMPGYRHVYLEGLTEASIFVHVSIHDVYGKGHQLRGIRGLFNRSSKSSVDTNSSGLRKRSISDHLLRRTASAPAKGRKKTKMLLSESVASISDQKNGTGMAAGGEGVSGKEGGVEKRLQARGPLIHRPISMPLDRLLQGQLSLCSPEKEQHDMGVYPLNRPKSSSVDLLIESSFSIEPNVSSPSQKYRIKQTDQPAETSYLVIGGGEVRREEDYANYQKTEQNAVSTSKIISTGTEKNCLASPSAPVVSLSSSYGPTSVALLSPVNMDCDPKSPSSLHDSAISRLIDAVSLGNEQDTCGSISALIGKFESTVEDNVFKLSHDHTPSNHSNFRSTIPKTLQDLRPPLTTNTAAPNTKHLIISQADASAPALLSSPETAELEEVYTILDEEVLLPVSVYNLSKQSFHVQADTIERMPSNSLGSSPAEVPSPVHRLVNCRPSNSSPLCHTSYPSPQNNCKALNHSRDLSSSYTQQRTYSGSQILSRSDRLENKQMEREQVSHLDYDCKMPLSKSQHTQPHSQSETRPPTLNQSWNQESPSFRHQSQAETRESLHSNLSSHFQSAAIDSIAPNPCKSKSLGDLTSEDISCNFQSKYHIISRSFITPHMRKQKKMGTMGEVTFQSHSCDTLTEQLRKLVMSQPQATSITPAVPLDIDDSPPFLTRRLSSRSQSRVRHINSRARERQQEALKSRTGVVINSANSIGGVVLRNKPASQNPPANRHSTGSYIAGYLGQLEDRGLPEGACTSLLYGNGDHYGDQYYTDNSLPAADSSRSASEPEVYFLLRL
uniref:Phosphoinositide phospholipase C n=1 Tax=Mastacembelus armatus TaxID=205130 RepID=A0A7N8XC60_9TELE